MKRSWIARHPPQRKLRETEEDKAYRAWVHAQSCVGSEFAGHGCEGPLQQAHVRFQTGMSAYPPEAHSLPMCMSLHDQFDGRARGIFDGMSNFEKFSWAMPRLEEHWKRFAAR